MDNGTERLEYEAAMRAIGRHLDAEPVHHISMVQMPDGFTVRSLQTGQHEEARSIHFTWERLSDLVIFQQASRGLPKRKPRHSGLWANFPNGHEDFFRALGHILDEEHGSDLTVEEVPEGIAISYRRPVGAGAETHRRIMQRAEIEDLLAEAQGRRARAMV